MCFSNLPIAFDEHGDPYLTDEAEDVGDPGTHTTTATDCGCGTDDAPLDATDPEDAFADILDSVSDASRMHLTDIGSGDANPDSGRVNVDTTADSDADAGGGPAPDSADGD